MLNKSEQSSGEFLWNFKCNEVLTKTYFSAFILRKINSTPGLKSFPDLTFTNFPKRKQERANLGKQLTHESSDSLWTKYFAKLKRNYP